MIEWERERERERFLGATTMALFQSPSVLYDTLVDSAPVNVMKYASNEVNTWYLKLWNSQEWLEMTLPLKYGVRGGGVNEICMDENDKASPYHVPLTIKEMSEKGIYPMPADILFFGILVCILISILRYVLDSNLFIRLSHSYDAKLLLAKKSIEWHKRDCKERGVGVDERKLERLQELFDTRQKKFCECCWRIVLYVSFSIYGIACIKKYVELPPLLAKWNLTGHIKLLTLNGMIMCVGVVEIQGI